MMPQIKSIINKAQRAMLQERRRYERAPCLEPVRFAQVGGKTTQPLQPAKTKNVSRGGLKISCMTPLEPKSIVLLDLDLNLLYRYIGSEELLMVSKRRILTEVAWRKLNLETGLFEIGLEFWGAAKRDRYTTAIQQAAKVN